MLNSSRAPTADEPGVMLIRCIPVTPAPSAPDSVWLRQPWIIVLVIIGVIALAVLSIWWVCVGFVSCWGKECCLGSLELLHRSS